jgi:NitT/TauT family transport system permease protein
MTVAAGEARTIIRPEREAPPIETASHGQIKRELTVVERFSDLEVVRKFTILLAVVVAWELYTRWGAISELILPRFSLTTEALWNAIVAEQLLAMIWNSLKVLVSGYAIGVLIAALLTTLATLTRFGSDVLGTLTAMLNPLPAIALLPLAMLWFGLGPSAIIFTLLHSIVWPVALNAHTGFMAVSETQRMVGRNYGLKGVSYVVKLLIPAALPSILMGLRIGWAFAWRTLIAAELVFGGSVIDAEGTNSGGLGWFIFANQAELQVASVFAGLFTVILVGFLVESMIFNAIERRTIRRWGMQTT